VKLHVDLETLQLIEGPGFRNPVTALRFKRGDSARLEVSFLEGGITAAHIGDPAQLEIQFGIKPRNRYDIGYLVHSADWTMPAIDAEAPVYQCSPGFNTVELDSALGVGSATGTELAEITLMGEITWREGAGQPTSTRTFLVIVENDVNRGTEGVPASAEPAYPAPAQIALLSQVTPILRSVAQGPPTPSIAPVILGRLCIVGDTGGPYRTFLAVQLSPVIWLETTPGVVTNTTRSVAQKLTTTGTATNEVIQIADL
jgi:hypothetical protein